MRIRIIFALMIAAAATLASQQTFTFGRKYSVGDKDAYTFKMSMESGYGSVDITAEMTQTVVKTYDSGEADVEVETNNLQMQFNGQPTNNDSKPAKSTLRYDKYGIVRQPAGATSGQKSLGGFSELTNIGYDKPLTVGQTVTFEKTDPNNSKAKSAGTIKLESIEKGVAKIISKVTITIEGQKSPMKVNMTSLFDVATGKPNKIEGTVSGMQIGGQDGQMDIQSATISMVRK